LLLQYLNKYGIKSFAYLGFYFLSFVGNDYHSQENSFNGNDPSALTQTRKKLQCNSFTATSKNSTSLKLIQTRVAIRLFLKLFARNKMIWPFLDVEENSIF